MTDVNDTKTIAVPDDVQAVGAAAAAAVAVVHHQPDCELLPPAADHVTLPHCQLERMPAECGKAGLVSDVLRLPATAGNSSAGLTLRAPPSRH